jgi:hypothetical protein
MPDFSFCGAAMLIEGVGANALKMAVLSVSLWRLFLFPRSVRRNIGKKSVCASGFLKG